MEIGESVSVELGIINVDSDDTDWIAFRLIRDDNHTGIGSEPLDATLTNASQCVELSGNGVVNFHGLSPGSCAIKFPDFYDGIVGWIDERLS